MDWTLTYASAVPHCGVHTKKRFWARVSDFYAIWLKSEIVYSGAVWVAINRHWAEKSAALPENGAIYVQS